jgi:phosphoglycerate dehydrogenase-like enzyme
MALVIDCCVVPDAERHVLRRLQNLKAGLLGFGNIGRAVARKLAECGASVADS